MDVLSGSLLWPKENGPIRTYPPLQEDISCDVAIVGAGIIGALLAYRLSAQGYSVTVLDKRDVAGGSTSASTALLMPNLDVNLTDLTKMIGRKKAIRAYRLSKRSVTDIKQLLEELNIGCDYKEKKILYVASEKSDAKMMKKECALLKEAGFNAEYADRNALKETFGLENEAAIICHEAAEVDPYVFTHELIRHAVQKGAKVYAHTKVTGYQQKKNKTVLKTKHAKVTARQVVMATGYESVQYLEQNIVQLKSSYVIASKPVPDLEKHWLNDYLVWETARPYLYIRTTCNHRILVVGEDIDTVNDKKRDRLIAKKSKLLERKFEALIGNLPLETEYSWAGTFGESADGLGYIGVPKGYKHIYFALGFGGNGVTFGVIAADMLSRMIVDGKAEDEELFSFKR